MAREQQIIDAAIGLIQLQGIENLTIDKVVAKVPYSKCTIYKYFLGKEYILLAISNQAVKKITFINRIIKYWKKMYNPINMVAYKANWKLFSCTHIRSVSCSLFILDYFYIYSVTYVKTQYFHWNTESLSLNTQEVNYGYVSVA